MDNCPRCSIEMQLGKAIKTESGSFIRCMPATRINASNLEMVAVQKCKLCGHSEELTSSLISDTIQEE